ncbi:hypothetical protein K439DRAFT_1618129 [Ramaria rubella]|nr:hypothetical protein K439DRAFT_1618129 [Ramaria rubella]
MYHTLMKQSMLWPYTIVVWRQFQQSCVDLIAFCNYQDASEDMRTHLRPAQSACITFRGVFSPDPNVIKLLACLGAPAFHVRVLDEPPPLERKVQLRSWTMFEAFHALVVIGDEWWVTELFVEMFKSAA